MIPAILFLGYVWIEDASQNKFDYNAFFIYCGVTVGFTFAIEGIVITFLYGDLVWGFFSLAIFVVGIRIYNGERNDLIIVIDCALGIIFGVVFGGGLAFILLILFLAGFSTMLLEYILAKNKRYEKVIFNLLTILKTYLKENPSVGEVIASKLTLKLPNGHYSFPDVVIGSPGIIQDKDSTFEGIPTVVIEIFSPSTTLEYDVLDKRKCYQDNKVPEIWFIDLRERSVLIESIQLDGTYTYQKYHEKIIKSKVLRKLKIKFDDIFAD